MFVLFMWYFSMLYIIVCLHHCMYVCYMFIKYQSINQSATCIHSNSSESNPFRPEFIFRTSPRRTPKKKRRYTTVHGGGGRGGRDGSEGSTTSHWSARLVSSGQCWSLLASWLAVRPQSWRSRSHTTQPAFTQQYSSRPASTFDLHNSIYIHSIHRVGKNAIKVKWKAISLNAWISIWIRFGKRL